MGKGELRARPHRLDLVDATRVTLGFELRLPFIQPTHRQPLLRNALENLARVHEASVRIHSPRRADLPFAFDAHSEAILLYELARSECMPELLRVVRM